MIRTSVIFWSLTSLYAARGTHVPVRYVAATPSPGEVAAGSDSAAGQDPPSVGEAADEDLAAFVAREAPAALERVATVESSAPSSARSAAAGDGETSLPLAFALGPAFPNPAGGACAIPLRLPRAAEVRLRVFDDAGRLVRDLSPGPMAAGVRVVRWDGRDETGARVAAGLYWVQARAPEWQSRIRVVIAR